MDVYTKLSQKISEVEDELRNIGFWSDKIIQIYPTECKEPFCGDKLDFEQWLQFVFIPNVKKMVLERGSLPDDSRLGIKSMREYDYMSVEPKAKKLIALLTSIDELIKRHKEDDGSIEIKI